MRGDVRLAEALRELRAAAGNPSYRTMAGRSGRISHTTLFEAATGSRLPSWETVREFVRACGVDDGPWRGRWEEAVSAGGGAAPLPLVALPGVAEVEGDAINFVADVTCPDGTRVLAGERFVKVWEFENCGKVPWHRRALRALHPDAAVPDRIAIGDTDPGDHVMISVSVVAPDEPGTWWVGWKMVDGLDRLVFPNQRPVYFCVTVVAA